MTTVYLVRHGEASASWGESNDPGLSQVGIEQAKLTCEKLGRKGVMPIIASPKLRAIETGQALSETWGRNIVIDNRFTEIPTPNLVGDRSVWLKKIMASNWEQMDEAMIFWQKNIITALSEIKQPSVIFSHFMVINAIAATVSNKPEVLQQMPNYASINQVVIDQGEVVEFIAGEQLSTKVN